MKNIYILTCHDSSTNSFVATQYYSNRQAALGSFKELKSHLLKKYNIDENDVKRWTFTEGGDHQTEILGSRLNVTLVKHSISKDISKFI